MTNAVPGFHTGAAFFIADGYLERFDAINSSDHQTGYSRTEAVTTPTLLARFAERQFRHSFRQN